MRNLRIALLLALAPVAANLITANTAEACQVCSTQHKCVLAMGDGYNVCYENFDVGGHIIPCLAKFTCIGG